MRELTKLLEIIVHEVQFSVVVQRTIGEHIEKITPGRVGTTIPAAELRSVFDSRNWQNEHLMKEMSTHPDIPHRLYEELVAKLGELLHSHLSADGSQIGHVVPTANSVQSFFTIQKNTLMRRAWVSTVDDFAELMVRGAALLGSERAVQLLCDWVDGKTLRYRTSALLVGVTVDQPLQLPEGICITPLSTSSDDLPAGFPRSIETLVEHFLGRVVLSVDSTVAPVLFSPADNHERSRWHEATSVLGEKTLDQLCQALSLVCSSHVSYTKAWNDYGQLRAFSFGNEGGNTRLTSVRETTGTGYKVSRDLSTGMLVTT